MAGVLPVPPKERLPTAIDGKDGFVDFKTLWSKHQFLI